MKKNNSCWIGHSARVKNSFYNIEEGTKKQFKKSVDNQTKIVNDNLERYPKKMKIGPDYGHKT
jgi:hypothetical protein